VSIGILLKLFGDAWTAACARTAHIERPRYGFFIDHVVDTLIEILVLASAWASHRTSISTLP